jgi:hypothetical protein
MHHGKDFHHLILQSEDDAVWESENATLSYVGVDDGKEQRLESDPSNGRIDGRCKTPAKSCSLALIVMNASRSSERASG